MSISKSEADPAAVSEKSTVQPPVATIGRQAEWANISERLEELYARSGGKLAVRAESGLGKSHLSRQMKAEAERLGFHAILTPCRGTRHRGYQPLFDIIRSLLNVDETHPPYQQLARLEQALAGLELSHLASVFSDLLRISPTQGAGEELLETPAVREESLEETMAGLSAKMSLPHALTTLLTGYAVQRGLCIIFDDLDESSERTIQAALKLVEALHGKRILLAATFPPHSSPVLNAVFAQDAVTLAPLGRADSQQLGAAFLHMVALPPTLADMLWARTQGNPLHITLLARRLVESGSTTEEETPSLTASQPAQDLSQLVAEMFNSLSESRKAILTCGSVIGDGFRMGALTALLKAAHATDLLPDMDALVRDGWLEVTGAGRMASYRFANRVTRDAVYQNTPPEQKTRLHGHAGDYYAVAVGGRKSRPENAVEHYIKAGNLQRIVPIIEMAVPRLLAAGDREQAIQICQLGISAIESDSSLSDKQVVLAERLGDIYAASADYTQAADAYTRFSPSVTSVTLYAKLGLTLLVADPARAVNILSRALTVVQGSKYEDLRWILEASFAWALALAGNSYEAIRRTRDTLGKLGDTVGFGLERSMMRAMLGIILFYEGDLNEAHPHLESARAGWGARGYQDGVMLINQVLISMPRPEVSRMWLKMVMGPLLK